MKILDIILTIVAIIDILIMAKLAIIYKDKGFNYKHIITFAIYILLISFIQTRILKKIIVIFILIAALFVITIANWNKMFNEKKVQTILLTLIVDICLLLLIYFCI